MTAPTLPHSSYLGSSDIARILGLSPFGTALDVWAEKLGKIQVEETEAMTRGNETEASTLAGYARRTGRQLESDQHTRLLVPKNDVAIAMQPRRREGEAGLAAGPHQYLDLYCGRGGIGRRRQERDGEAVQPARAETE